MKAAVTKRPGEIEISEVDEPRPGLSDAIVRVLDVGLCGSDIHFFSGHHPYARYPQIQGHEFSGIVERLPASYEGPCCEGDLVAVEPLLSCGVCFPCRRGRPNCCVRLEVLGVHVAGALAERIAVPATTLHGAAGLTAELAALVEPCSIGLEAVTRANIVSGDKVLVLGAGPIGQAVMVAALDHGAEVAVAERLANRLGLAAKLGATMVVDVSSTDLAGHISDWTGAEGPVAVVEATGVPELIRQAVDLVAPSGTVVVVGLSDRDVSLPIIDVTRKELNLLGSRNNSGLFGQSVGLVRRNADRLTDLITHRFPLLEAGDAMRFVSTNQANAAKVLVTVHEADL